MKESSPESLLVPSSSPLLDQDEDEDEYGNKNENKKRVHSTGNIDSFCIIPSSQWWENSEFEDIYFIQESKPKFSKTCYKNEDFVFKEMNNKNYNKSTKIKSEYITISDSEDDIFDGDDKESLNYNDFFIPSTDPHESSISIQEENDTDDDFYNKKFIVPTSFLESSDIKEKISRDITPNFKFENNYLKDEFELKSNSKVSHIYDCDIGVNNSNESNREKTIKNKNSDSDLDCVYESTEIILPDTLITRLSSPLDSQFSLN